MYHLIHCIHPHRHKFHLRIQQRLLSIQVQEHSYHEGHQLKYKEVNKFKWLCQLPIYYYSYGTVLKVSKGAKIRNRYNHAPHLTQDTYGKVTNSQLDTTNESQEASLFPAGDHKAQINRRVQRHSKHKIEKI